jgi:hypothetical protein
MAVNLSLLAGAGWQFFDDNGDPLSGGKLFTYAAGTTTPQVTYTSSSGATANANPIILNAAGRLSGSGEIWLTEGVLYKFVLNDSNNVLIGTYDNISGANDGTSIYAALANSSDPAKGDALVGFRQSNSSGNLAGSVGRTVHQKLQEIISFKDFGAVGDGVTNDAAAVLAALDSGAKVIDGQGLTYKINIPLAPSSQNIAVQNAVFDFSGVPDQPGSPDKILSFSGSKGTATNLSANATAGTFVLTVVSTSGFAADGYAWLTSSTVFESSQSVILGQIVQIKSVDSATQLTLYNDVLYDFTTAATANISPLTMKRNIRFQGVRFIGANASTQSMLDFDMCADVEVTGCSFDFCDYVACRVSRTVNFLADNCTVRRARAVGTSYGFAVGNGAYSVKIANSYGEDLRHFVTVGDNDGVNLFVTVTGCHVAACQDAGIDAHAACDFMVIDGNTIEGSSFDSGQLDGIIFQGLNCVISNNIVVGARRHSIFHQFLPDIGTGSSVISGNHIRNAGGAVGTETAILVATQPGSGGSSLDGVSITGNVVSGASNQDFSVYALSANIKNVAISGNVVNDASDVFCCLLRADAGYSLEDFVISGNVFKTSGVSNVYLLGETSPNILNGTIIGNTIKGGDNGIRMIQTQNVMETGNYNTGTTRRVFVDTGSGPAWLDRRQSSVVTMTNSTYVVLDQDEYLTANRAGTITVTLPAPATWPGRVLNIKTIQAQSVVSNASNVVPIDDSVAGTAILPATDGSWAQLVSDGTNWVIAQRG